MSFRVAITLLCLAAVLGGCHGCDEPSVGPLVREVAVTPASLTFRTTEVSRRRELGLTLRNGGRAAARIEFHLSGSGPFQRPETLSLPSGAERTVQVGFAPEGAGTFEDTLTLEVDGASREVPLRGEALQCAPSGVCRTSSFDEETASCVEDVWSDGTFCKTPCLIGGHCRGGVCEGFAVDCDDDNPCTVDDCDESVGCVNEVSLSSCPAPEEVCRVPVCSPETGCGTAVAADGSPCETACIVGVCQQGGCVGEERSCDDGNACTADTCNPEMGCVHEDVSNDCPTSDPCQVPVCRPSTGCATSPLADDTPCGPATCQSIQLCQSGVCTESPTPQLGTCACNDVRPLQRLAVGGFHACRITPADTVECWGSNRGGQLGDGTFQDRSLPTPVPGLQDVVEISADNAGTFARTSAGDVYHWGWREFSNEIDNQPMLFSDLSNVVSFYGIEGSQCAVEANGSVWCRGPIGIPAYNPEFAPIPDIAGAKLVSAVGPASACVLFDDTTVQCWGLNNSFIGLLGNGTYENASPLRPALTPRGPLHGAVELDWVGPPCVRNLYGEVLCGPYGLDFEAEELYPQMGPYFGRVAIGGCATQISASPFHGCARLDGGTVRCWGLRNDDGQLGTGDTLPPPQGLSDVSGLSHVTEIRTGQFFSCATFEDGGYRCWGNNDSGQLGDGTTTSRLAP